MHIFFIIILVILQPFLGASSNFSYNDPSSEEFGTLGLFEAFEDFIPDNNYVDFEVPEITKEWIEQELIPLFERDKMINSTLIIKIINDVGKIFNWESTIEQVDIPINGKIIVVGDIHGQFESTLNIFKDFGYPSEDLKYIFNGDIIDRGEKSLECLLMIYAYKIALPFSFHVTRGNHESRSVSRDTFYEECQSKLSDYPEAFDDFHNSFESLPYAYVIKNYFFVTHGGLSPGINIKKLKSIARSHFNYENDYMLRGFLWNDPADPSEPVNQYGLRSSPRGKECFRFHPMVTYDFLKRNNLHLLVRSHQAVPEGYQFCHNNRCLTIFSAPNYCQRGTDGTVLLISEDKYEIKKMR